MRHAPLESWADYVLGLGTAPHRRQLAHHLAACDQCARTVAFLNEVASVVHMDAHLAAIPADVFRGAVSVFSGGHMARRPGMASPHVSRPLRFETAEARVLLRVATRPRAGLAVIGEVRDARAGTPLAAADVSLHGGTDAAALAQTRTTSSGGFVLECAEFASVRLRVTLPGGRRAIDIAVPPGDRADGATDRSH